MNEMKVKIKKKGTTGEGEWFEVPLNVTEVSSRIGVEEDDIDDREGYVITETTCPFPVEEDEYLSDIDDMANMFEDLPKELQECFKELLDYQSAEDILNSGGEDFRVYEAGSEEELAEALVDELGFDSIGKENLERYFDYEAYGRNFAIESSGFFGNGGYIEYIN